MPKWWRRNCSIQLCCRNSHKINWTNPAEKQKCTKYISLSSFYVFCDVLQANRNKLYLFLMTKPAESVLFVFLHKTRYGNIQMLGPNICRQTNYLYFPSMVFRLWTICIIINTEPQQDVHSLSKWFLLVCRSISVPYAYQCCAFIGCDLTTRSSAEHDVKKSTGGNAAVSVFSLKHLAC